MANQSFLYGISPVHQCLLHENRQCYELLVKPKSKSPRVKEILSLARHRKIPVKDCDPNQLGRITNTKLHQGVVLMCSELKRTSLDDFLDPNDDNLTIEGYPAPVRAVITGVA